MKRKILSAVALLIAILCIPAAVAFAHSGGTDENGGHWDHSTGTYHYHHGYPANQHPNGVCPYLDDAPEESSESSSPAIVYTSSTSSEDNTGPPITQAEAREMVQEASHRAYDQGRDDGREVGYESGYEEGQDIGYDMGYEDGYDIGINERASEGEDQRVYFYLSLLACGILLIILALTARKGQNLESDNDYLKRKLDNQSQELENQDEHLEKLRHDHDVLSKDYKALYTEHRVVQRKMADLESLSDDYANLFQKYMTLKNDAISRKMEEELADYDYSAFWLTNKSRPAPKEAKRIKELEKETKQWIERALRAEAELETLRGLRIVRRLTDGSTPEK